MVRTLPHGKKERGRERGERGPAEAARRLKGKKEQATKMVRLYRAKQPSLLGWRSLAREEVYYPGGPCIACRTWGIQGEPGSQCSL